MTKWQVPRDDWTYAILVRAAVKFGDVDMLASTWEHFRVRVSWESRGPCHVTSLPPQSGALTCSSRCVLWPHTVRALSVLAMKTYLLPDTITKHGVDVHQTCLSHPLEAPS